MSDIERNPLPPNVLLGGSPSLPTDYRHGRGRIMVVSTGLNSKPVESHKPPILRHKP